MKRYGLMFVACSALLAALVLGCGAEVEVARDRIRQKIDNALGALDVKQKEVELSVNGLKTGIDGLRRAKIKALVSSDQIQRRAKPQEDRLTSMDAALKTLRGHLTADKPVDIAGRTYPAQEVREMAERIVEARKACATQLEGFHDSQARLRKVASALERKQSDAEARLAQIEGQLTVIDTNRIALTAMQESAVTLGENDGTLAKSLDKLQGKVDDLFADVEVELRCEDARWAETDAASKEVDAVETTLARLQDSHDMVTEIDKILGKR